ncbi:MAG: hypothetical protein Q7S36_00580 [Candidatus Liptonbacteria bacterium]|nr:hypothetical protein [Candidatus Liptonbacteria bacterium]
MKRLCLLLAVLAFALFPLSASASEPAPQKGEIEEITPDAVYYFAFGRMDTNLVTTNVFRENIAYFMDSHKDLRIQSLTPKLGPAESNCAMPNLPIPGKTAGYWVFFRKALPDEPGQDLLWTPETNLQVWLKQEKGIVAAAPLNRSDTGALSGYYVVFTLHKDN